MDVQKGKTGAKKHVSQVISLYALPSGERGHKWLSKRFPMVRNGKVGVARSEKHISSFFGGAMGWKSASNGDVGSWIY